MEDPADPLCYRAAWAVRHYELDGNGHVNNAVYLNYAEALTLEHAERSGYGREWTTARGGAWLVHRNVASYHRPALYPELLDLRVRVLYVRGARGIRHTEIRRHDGELLCEVLTEWVWTRLVDGRPARVPAELIEAAAAATEETLRRNPDLVTNLRRGASI
ncbi:MAG: acyl-CoA thioesterase [Candidatus Dormibacteraceae bacterium]